MRYISYEQIFPKFEILVICFWTPPVNKNYWNNFVKTTHETGTLPGMETLKIKFILGRFKIFVLSPFCFIYPRRPCEPLDGVHHQSWTNDVTIKRVGIRLSSMLPDV